MCSCHSILECCVTFSGVKLSIRSFVLFLKFAVKILYFQNFGLTNNCLVEVVPK